MKKMVWMMCLALQLIVVPSVYAEESPFLGGFLQESRVVYPLKIDGWQAVAEERLDGQGAAISYLDPAQKDAQLAIYFYPVGVIGPGKLEQMAQKGLDSVVALVGNPQTMYRSVDAENLREVSLPRGDSRKPLSGYLATMRIDEDGQLFDSALGMLSKDLYLIDVRLSIPAGVVEAAPLQLQMEKMLRQMVRYASVFNTGECWNPLPMVARAKLTVPAEGVVLKLDGDDGPSVIALSDRVEAVQPESPEAKSVQFLASILMDRIVPSCVSPEDINPTVPEGARELRLEYRRAQSSAEAGVSGGH